MLVVEADSFALPLEKGAGSWVQQAYDDAAAGGRLVFTPVFTGKAVAAYKEGAEDYKSIWLGRFGFPTTTALSSAFTAAAGTNSKVKASLADPGVEAVVTGLQTGLDAAKCDVDHIVEKQMGGTSIPSNLQLLTKEKNRASGREAYQALVKIVNEIRDPSMRGEDVRRLQIRLRKATVPPGTPDPSFVVESHLRAGDVVGSAALMAKAAGKPVALKAGGVGETVAVADTGATPLEAMAKRIVPGMRLRTYTRGTAGASSKRDAVEGELDSRAISIVEGKKGGGGADPTVHLFADLAPAVAGAPAAAPEPAGGAGAPDPTAAAPGEARTLGLDTAKNTKVAFYYPYLSPGTLTTLALDDQGQLTGAGTIRSSVPFLGTLNVVYSAGELKLLAPIPAERLVSPLPAAFRFTGGQLALQLSPELVPSGTVTFSVGPAAKPIILGDLTAKMAGGALVATGTLTPAGRIPGVSAVAGVVEWSSETGWSGRIKAQDHVHPGVERGRRDRLRHSGRAARPVRQGRYRHQGPRHRDAPGRPLGRPGAELLGVGRRGQAAAAGRDGQARGPAIRARTVARGRRRRRLAGDHLFHARRLLPQGGRRGGPLLRVGHDRGQDREGRRVHRAVVRRRGARLGQGHDRLPGHQGPAAGARRRADQGPGCQGRR